MAAKRVCLVLQFRSVGRAVDATDFLYGNELWVQRFYDRVAVYVPSGQQPHRVEKAALHALREGGMGDEVLGEIRELAWNESAQCFVDPDDPGTDGILGTVIEDAEFDALGSRWEVTVRPSSIFVHRAVRGELVALRRPFLDATGEHYVLGALDADDAAAVAAAAQRLSGVRDATVRRLTWLDRWRLRQQFAGNYAVADPSVPF
jgi:hypothetical protein